MTSRTNKLPCPDCGEYPVNHPAEWMGAVIDTGVTAITRPLDRGMRKLRSGLSKTVSTDRMALPLYRALAFLRLGTLKNDVDELDSARTRFLWDSAKRRGITLHHFRVMGEPTGIDLFVAEKDGAWRSFEGLPRPQRAPSPSIAWMDDKAILKKKLTAAGIPMAKGKACFTYKEALRVMHEVGTPVITKPHIGSRSRHSTVRIMTPEELRIGFSKAKRLSPWVIVEQELQGYLFRVLLVDGEVRGIIRREVAHVMGDGTHTVRELFDRENKNPRRNGPTFHHLHDDADAEAELARQGIGWSTVPAKGAIVNFSNHISRHYGGSTSDFTDRVHPDNLVLFKKIASTLGDSLVGVDFIIRDMEKSWREQKLCGVIECNSLPNIDLHHDVLYGENRDIAGLLLDIAFALRKRKHWNERHALIAEPTELSGYGPSVEPFFPRKSIVCDLGGGQGRDARYFLAHGHVVNLLDVSDLALANAKESADKEGFAARLETHQVDIADARFPLPNDSQDVVYSRLALHYFRLENTEKILQEIKRCLKPGGMAFLAVKSSDDAAEMAYLKSTSKEIEHNVFQDKHTTKSRFSKSIWEEMLGRLGVQKFSVGFYEERFAGKKQKPESGNETLLLCDIRFVK